LGDTVSYHHLPQDSVLRRHYLTHLRHMIETVAMPSPTDSVLRRHHEHLILKKALARSIRAVCY
jgi:hypothetical protein